MAALIKHALYGYTVLFEEYSDPRVKDWPLMGSPLPILALLIAYNYFIKTLGPRLMEKRNPLNINNAMIAYNLAQILFNGYFVYESFRWIWFRGEYSLWCAEVDYSPTFLPMKIAFNVWLFFISKILDLLDTVFMVLRKKNNQISFLHVYHHTGMVIATWMAVKYVAGGHGVFFGTVNAFVHTVMYTYYLVTALYPEYKNSVWKRHITEIQLIQFVVTSAHGLVGIMNQSCNYPKTLLAIFIPQDVFMFFLFWDFYKKAYLNKKGNKNVTKVQSNGDVSVNSKEASASPVDPPSNQPTPEKKRN